jgi:SAM-dependent methyltransferase
MINDLVRFHHEVYSDDLAFWISRTEGRDPVLELGAGHGRVTLPLRQAGRQVFGLDYKEESLRYTKGAAQESDLKSIDLVLADMRKLPLRADFGAVILPCNTYSIFTKAEREWLLSSIFTRLHQDGIFIASMPNPVAIHDLYQELLQEGSEIGPDLETNFIHPETNHPVQVSSLCKAGKNLLSWEWIYDHLLPDGTQERSIYKTEHHLGSLEEYQFEISHAGFMQTEFLGDFSGNPYLEDSDYLIIECLKSDSSEASE